MNSWGRGRGGFPGAGRGSDREQNGKNRSEERRKEIGREEGKGREIREKINVAEVQCSLLPSLLSGLFPGDAILEVNGERVKYAPVEKVVEAITRVPTDSSEMSVRLIYH